MHLATRKRGQEYLERISLLMCAQFERLGRFYYGWQFYSTPLCVGRKCIFVQLRRDWRKAAAANWLEKSLYNHLGGKKKEASFWCDNWLAIRSTSSA